MTPAAIKPNSMVADRYQIGEKLCNTSLGELYGARDLKYESDVSIEILGAVGNDDEKVERFLQEIDLLKELNHSNILVPRDAGWDDIVYYLVTDRLPGRTLQEDLKKGTVEEMNALVYASSVASALDYVWQERKIIHRDIKPQHIFIGNDNQTRLTGFGIAKSSETGVSGLTGEGYTIGTPEYMSPEQIRADESLDFRADMYSLGCVLYETFTGTIPFPDNAPILMMQRHLDEAPQPVQQKNHHITEASSKIVHRLLEKECNQRYSSWTSLLGDLNDVILSLSSSVTTYCTMPEGTDLRLNDDDKTEEINFGSSPNRRGGPIKANPTPDRESVLGYLHTRSKVPISETLLEFTGDAFPKEKYETRGEVETDSGSATFLAIDCDLDRRLVMKTMLPGDQKSPQRIAKFFKFARTLGQLTHSNIQTLYDVGISLHGELYCAMQKPHGISLTNLIANLRMGDKGICKEYTWTRRIQIIQDVCDAIQCAHQKGILHGDLKPENIWVSELGEVVVTGWEKANSIKILQRIQKPASISPDKQMRASNATDVNTMLGDPGYLSPEQVLGNSSKVSFPSDIYSIGAIMFELFTLQRPHTGSNIQEVLNNIVNGQLPVMRKIKCAAQGKVPIEIQYIVEKAMDKKPTKRYKSAKYFKMATQRYLEGTFPSRCARTKIKNWALKFSRWVG